MVFVLNELYKLHEHFGVRGAFERIAFLLKESLQTGVVLNDTIVY